MTYSEKLKDPRWQKKRLEILNRDEFTCRLCGDDKLTLHVHHICYNGNPWEANSDRLITLCEACHEEETDLLKKSQVKCVTDLKDAGFMSMGFESLSKIFKDTDRGWTFYDPSFDIIKMAVDDDELWQPLHDEFLRRLISKKSLHHGS